MEHVELLAPRINDLQLSEAAMRDLRNYDEENPLHHEAIDYLADQLRSQDRYFNDYSHSERKRVVRHYVLDLDT